MADLLKGSMATFHRVFRLMAGLKPARIEVGAPGHEVKVKAAIRRGDQIPTDRVYAAVKRALEEGWGEDMDPADLMVEAAQAIEDEVRAALTDGRVTGPKRGPDKKDPRKLVETGDLAEALKAEITK